MADAPRPTLLCILDGFGLNPNPKGNAIALANTPTVDQLFESSPHSTLTTFGESVGLPEGQMGNSEVGHLNIGAGRVVEQWLLRISRELQGGVLSRSPEVKKLCEDVSGSLHLVGLFSEGGVHSHGKHLRELIESLVETTHHQIVLHLITDGRDESPTAGADYVQALEEELNTNERVSIGSICGRFFAMDRDKRWERVQVAYDAIMLGKAPSVESASDYIRSCYEKGETDEFLPPAIVSSKPIQPEDGVIFFNFRADRMREIVRALCLADCPDLDRKIEPIKHALCFTEYDATFKLPVLFHPQTIENHLGQVVSAAGLRQLRTAETEKYPHVTYFLNGGIEEPLPGEARELVPSPRDVKTYDLKPEMSAHGITEKVIEGIRSRDFDLIVVNFANPDMVGHTGVIEAAVKAVETVDQCLGKILTELQTAGGQAVIIADHGNADQMINYEDGSPHTAHTTHPVPVIVFGRDDIGSLREGGALCDVAPTVLQLMALPQPKEMTGRSLVVQR